MADADGASKFADLARLEQALDDLNGRKVCSLLIWKIFLIKCNQELSVDSEVATHEPMKMQKSGGEQLLFAKLGELDSWAVSLQMQSSVLTPCCMGHFVGETSALQW